MKNTEQQNKAKRFEIGQRVYWNDPAGETSGEYYVIGVRDSDNNYTDEGAECDDDHIITIGNSHSEAEVLAAELDIVCNDTPRQR